MRNERIYDSKLQPSPILDNLNTISNVPNLNALAEKLLLDEDIYKYHFVSQGKITIDGMDDCEEAKLTDVRIHPPVAQLKSVVGRPLRSQDRPSPSSRHQSHPASQYHILSTLNPEIKSCLSCYLILEACMSNSELIRIIALSQYPSLAVDANRLFNRIHLISL